MVSCLLFVLSPQIGTIISSDEMCINITRHRHHCSALSRWVDGAELFWGGRKESKWQRKEKQKGKGCVRVKESGRWTSGWRWLCAILLSSLSRTWSWFSSRVDTKDPIAELYYRIFGRHDGSSVSIHFHSLSHNLSRTTILEEKNSSNFCCREISGMASRSFNSAVNS